MPLREDILNPIAGNNPSGRDLRYSSVYDQIKEARREDDGLALGVWQHERKIADHVGAVKLTQDAIATESKDLQMAAWLTGSLLKTNGFTGLVEGLTLCCGLVERFWETLYPELEEGDGERRAAPLEWVGCMLDADVKMVALTRDGYTFLQHKDSRTVGYEDQAKTKEQKAARAEALAEGKLSAETFDKSFGETPKVFYREAEKSLDASLQALSSLDRLCRERFGDAAPTFGKLRTALEDVRHAVHGLLEKKREFDPDPVEQSPPAATGLEVINKETATAEVPIPTQLPSVAVGADLGDYTSAEAAVAAAAQFLRRRDPHSPAPYLMLRGLRWGELRASRDPLMLEAPPTEIRRQIKVLALSNMWPDLLEAAETAMGFPYGRAWLDLQRFVVQACVALGGDYHTIAIAIGSELRSLLRDLPELLAVTLSDDTPAANPETQAWLRELLAEPADAPASSNLPFLPEMNGSRETGWAKKFIDPHALALDAMRKGQPQKAFEILHTELEQQHSGRGRFQRKLQLAQISIAAGKDAVAQPLLDDIAATIEEHKLESWEDRQLVAGALAVLLQFSKRLESDARARQAVFERICRLDPVQAFSV
jgi:type VI secretion system protein ImpA